MQLPSDQEIIQVSGNSPIKAQKLRYYEDKNFTGRVLSPPKLTAPNLPYADVPISQGDDWNGCTRPVDDRLFGEEDQKANRAAHRAANEGGKEIKQELDEKKPEGDEIVPSVDLEDNTAEIDAKRVTELAKTTAIAKQAFAADNSPDIDLLDF
ncbi:MAG: hypothetical protein COB36_13155 [Alphaproteobacteria bacterium]|nr:MAG: hypothetical protein COB36_13155 [Alphaproteobacteria bacterium]